MFSFSLLYLLLNFMLLSPAEASESSTPRPLVVEIAKVYLVNFVILKMSEYSCCKLLKTLIDALDLAANLWYLLAFA